MSDVTRDEVRELVRDLRDDLVERMTAGFGGINSRLDALNGRVGRGEVVAAETASRVVNLEREVFPSTRSRDRNRPALTDEENRPALTRRELRLIWALLATLASMAMTIWGFLR